MPDTPPVRTYYLHSHADWFGPCTLDSIRERVAQGWIGSYVAVKVYDDGKEVEATDVGRLLEREGVVGRETLEDKTKPPNVRYAIRMDVGGTYCIWDSKTRAPAELRGKQKTGLRLKDALDDLDELIAGDRPWTENWKHDDT